MTKTFRLLPDIFSGWLLSLLKWSVNIFICHMLAGRDSVSKAAFAAGIFVANVYVPFCDLFVYIQDNFLFNQQVFSYVTHTGNGYFVHSDSADYTTSGIRSNQCGRAVYIRDNDTCQCWSVGWEPMLEPYEKFQAEIGLNYTKITNTTHGVTSSWTILVPEENESTEHWQLTVTASSDRNLTVFTYAEITLLSTYPTYGDFFYCHCDWNDEIKGIRLTNKAPVLWDKVNTVECLSDKQPDHYCASRADFLGAYSGFANPFFAKGGALPDSLGSNENYCAGLQFELPVRGGETWTLRQGIHICNHSETLDLQKFWAVSFEELKNRTIKSIREQFSRCRIHTPDEPLNALMNIWTRQMMRMGIMHCRWGTKGFRDIVQHCMGNTGIYLDLVRKTLVKCLSHQYSNGFAVRSFPAIHEDWHMQYNDSATWLVYAITEYLKETGDMAFLEERVLFLDQGSSTVRERLDLIVNTVYQDRGEHGLIRMRSGDWNDSFTMVGTQGRGESVWLTMFLIEAIRLVAELAEWQGEDTAAYHVKCCELSASVNTTAWEKDRYIRAINDYGEKIGSEDCSEGKVFLNTQSWAFIAGIASEEQKIAIIDTVDKNLKTSYGYTLHEPAYTHFDPHIGRLSSIEPGTLENVSVYIHGNAFWLLGLLKNGDAEAAYRVLEAINPCSPILADNEIVPYVFANCYYGPEYTKRPGKIEHSWITGSVNWLSISVIEFMLGIRRTYDGLSILPVLPQRWKLITAERVYRGCHYHFTVHNQGGQTMKITVDGNLHPVDRVLPVIEGKKLTVEVFV